MKTAFFALAAAALFIPIAAAANHQYEEPELSCVAVYPVVSVGNAGRFVAETNVDGPFFWVAGDYGFYDMGPTFVAPMTELGEQQVTVVWGSRRASCFVDVVGWGNYGEPFHPGMYTPYAPYDPGPNVVLTSVKLSAVPYTGLDVPYAALLLAVALLAAYAALIYPYAKRAFIVAVR